MNKPAVITTIIIGAGAATVAGFLLAPGFFAAQAELAAFAPTTSVSAPATVTPGAEGQVVVDSVAVAQDESAMNDLAQVSIYQAASLAQVGVVQPSLKSATDASGAPVELGVAVMTDGVPLIAVTADRKHFIVVVQSESGRYFGRLDAGVPISENAAGAPLTSADEVYAAAGVTVADGVLTVP